MIRLYKAVLFIGLLIIISGCSNEKKKVEKKEVVNVFKLSEFSGIYRFYGKSYSAAEILNEINNYPDSLQDSITYERVITNSFYESGLYIKIFDSLISVYNSDEKLMDEFMLDSASEKTLFFKLDSLKQGSATINDSALNIYGIKDIDSPMVFIKEI